MVLLLGLAPEEAVVGFVRAGSLPSASRSNVCLAAPFVRGRNNLVLAIAHWAWMFNSSSGHLIEKRNEGRLTGAKTEQID